MSSARPFGDRPRGDARWGSSLTAEAETRSARQDMLPSEQAADIAVRPKGFFLTCAARLRESRSLSEGPAGEVRESAEVESLEVQ